MLAKLLVCRHSIVRGRNKYFKKPDLDRALSEKDVEALGNATAPEVAAATNLGHAAASYICYGSELHIFSSVLQGTYEAHMHCIGLRSLIRAC